jgi:retron-type reverse transcriptase
VDADIREYVDRISHRCLMEKVESRISDSGVLDLIRRWLTQNIVQEMQEWTPIFKRLDGFIRRRLPATLRYQSKRPGGGRTHTDHQRWNNAYFAELWLFTFTKAHANASRSRCRNH